MFGMLDYRAHKLYWLLTRPLALAILIISYAIVVGSFLISLEYAQSFWVRLLVSIVSLEIISLLFALLVKVLGFALEKVFYFLVDVVPAEDRSREEALLVLKFGETMRLNFNLMNRPELFRETESERFIQLLNRASGWILRILRLTGVFSTSLLVSSPRERTEALLFEAQERWQRGERVKEFLMNDSLGFLKEQGLAAGRFEQLLSSAYARSVIYRYIVLLICFAVYYWQN